MNLQDLLVGFTALVQQQVTAIQAESTSVQDFTPGSILLANVESNANLAVHFESIASYLYAYARASTCASNDPTYNNPDLDSWLAQFKFSRLPATNATTNVVFSRLNTSQQALIPVGVLVTTTPTGNQSNASQATVQFEVIIDTENPNWNPLLQGYTVPINVASVSVPVMAVVPGLSGNVSANQITLMSTPILYINSVNNPSNVTNAVGVETDQAYLARFQLWINNLSKGTLGAIEAAIEAVQDGILYNVLNWVGIDVNGNPVPDQIGFFSIIIDDGTGNPPDSLITAVTNAINTTVALGIKFGVYKTQSVTVTIGANLLLDPTYDATALTAAVQKAIESYINNLSVGVPLEFTKLPNVIYLVSPGILNVQDLQVNGATNDITPTSVQSVKAGTITLTTSNPG